MRRYDPARGYVRVNGEGLCNFAPASLRALVGYGGLEPVRVAASIRSHVTQGWPEASEEDLEESGCGRGGHPRAPRRRGIDRPLGVRGRPSPRQGRLRRPRAAAGGGAPPGSA